MSRRISFLPLEVGIDTLRANPLRTALSTLGVVIGVAALVAILAFGDGLERYARAQIELTTDLQMVTVTPRTVETVDGVRIRRPSVAEISHDDIENLEAALQGLADVTLSLTGSAWVTVSGDTSRYPVLVTANWPSGRTVLPVDVALGRFLDSSDIESGNPAVVLSDKLARQLADGESMSQLLGQVMEVIGKEYEVVGILEEWEGERPAIAFIPLDPAARELLGDGGRRVPAANIKARRFEDVTQVREQVERWLVRRYGSADKDFAVASSRRRLEQARQVYFVMKLTLGCIAGISLIVGGIGIMNILLASVAERTREIGIRKAAGARRRDILLLFLAESVAVSGVGSLFGVILGMLAALGGTAMIRSITDAPVRAAFTWQSILAAVAAAVVIGLVFGTYPARRAAKLTPVEAIRHE